MQVRRKFTFSQHEVGLLSEVDDSRKAKKGLNVYQLMIGCEYNGIMHNTNHAQIMHNSCLRLKDTGEAVDFRKCFSATYLQSNDGDILHGHETPDT